MPGWQIHPEKLPNCVTTQNTPFDKDPGEYKSGPAHEILQMVHLLLGHLLRAHFLPSSTTDDTTAAAEHNS